MSELPKMLSAPCLPNSLPMHAKWLAGEGAGSWFVIEQHGSNFLVNRYSPSGELECSVQLEPDATVKLGLEYEFTFPSHCAKVTLLQSGHTITFTPT